MEVNVLNQVEYEEDNYVLLQVMDTINTDSVNTPTILCGWVKPLHDEQKSEPLFSRFTTQVYVLATLFLQSFPQSSTDNYIK